MNAWILSNEVVARINELGITAAPWSAGSPSKLDKLILEKQREFERKTKRKFEKAVEVVLLNGANTDVIVTPNYPVNSISSIQLLGINVGDITEVTSYRLDSNSGRIQMISSTNSCNYFPEGTMNIQVTYDFGYSVTPTNNMPDDIKDAIILMCCLDIIFRSPKDWEKEGLTNLKIADYSEGYGAGDYYGGIFGAQKKEWAKTIDEIVRKYKRILLV